MRNHQAWDRVAHMNAGKDRAIERRNRGETAGTHASWKRLAAARLTSERQQESEWDSFDHWLAEVAGRVREIISHSEFVIYSDRWAGFGFDLPREEPDEPSCNEIPY